MLFLHFTCPERHVEENRCFQNIFLVIFWRKRKKLSGVWQFFLGMVVETALNLPMGTFRGDVCFWRNCFLNFYGKSAELLSPLGQKLSDTVVKTAFYVSKRIFWTECFENFMFLRESMFLRKQTRSEIISGKSRNIVSRVVKTAF